MNTAIARIQKDIIECTNTNPDNPPIFVKPRQDCVDVVDCLVVGPPDTPYEFGFFQFEVRFPSTYPNAPPKCVIKTTDNDKTRLNPNLYSTGKVCLSILGTWTGESADEWRSTYSLRYVLEAIQSLIMTPKPYHNEPGYEQLDSQYAKPEEVEEYTNKIQHEVLRVAVCGVLDECIKNDHPFRDIIKNQFLLWFPHYEHIVQSNMENCASGKYNYTGLMQRLNSTKATLEAETEKWKEAGKGLTSTASGWQYLKLKNEHNIIKQGIPLEGVSVDTSKENLFYYSGSIFGPENSPYEGGIYNFEIVFGDEDAPARVKFITEMFHPHINKDGLPFIPVDVKNKDPVQHILRALLHLLKQPINSSPATWANVEAAKMFFASNNPDMQREYKRRVVRCLRNSVE